MSSKQLHMAGVRHARYSQPICPAGSRGTVILRLFGHNATSNAPTFRSGYIVKTGTGAAEEPGESLLVRVLSLTKLLTKRGLYAGSIHYRDLRNTLLDTLIVSASNGPQSVYSQHEPIIHECALSWCFKSMRPSYVWGDYQKEVTAISQNTTACPWPWNSFEVLED